MGEGEGEGEGERSMAFHAPMSVSVLISACVTRSSLRTWLGLGLG